MHPLVYRGAAIPTAHCTHALRTPQGSTQVSRRWQSGCKMEIQGDRRPERPERTMPILGDVLASAQSLP